MKTATLLLAVALLAVVALAQTPATVPATQPTTQAIADANAVLAAMKAKYSAAVGKGDSIPYVDSFCSKAGAVTQQDSTAILNAFLVLRSKLNAERLARPYGAKIFHVVTTKNGMAILTDATLTLPVGSSTPTITFP